MHWLYKKSGIYVVKWRWFLQSMASKNDISLCKLDLNIKKWTAVPGRVGFFKLEYKPFKGNNYFKASFSLKTKVLNQKGCKKKYLSWVYGVDRKIHH